MNTVLRPASRLLAAPAVAGWYTLASVLMTWPLARGLTRDLAWDLGDPLLNCWILAGNADRLWRFLRGDLTALAGFWSRGIFDPTPLTLAFSESLIPQTLQILPVWAFSHNAILCYNLIFLSTFVLSGLGVFLLVRHLTGDSRAAFVAGLIYAFVPYRVGQFSHLQVLSSQWMPFAILGFRRYFDGGTRLALVGAAAALWAQFLSCGYYLFYFAPVIAVYLLWEIVDRGRWRDYRALAALTATLAAVALTTVPFLLPYLEVRSLGLGQRPRAEVIFYSADVYSYLTTRPELRVWGDYARVFDKPEGTLFPGAVPIALGVLGVGAWLRRNTRRAAAATADHPQALWRRALGMTLLAALLALGGLILVVLLTGRIIVDVGPTRVMAASIWRLLQEALVVGLVLLALSPRARAFARGIPGSAVGFFVGMTAVAFLLSLGPRPQTMGHGIGTGPYELLMALVPGIDSVRVPARFGMIVMLGLAVLAGSGAHALLVRWRRAGPAVVTALSVLFVAEATVVPFELNGRLHADEYRLTPDGAMKRGADVPPVYRAVAQLDDAVLVELPFGVTAYELQYMFYAIEHGRPLVNGYSGFGPPHYGELGTALARWDVEPDQAWDALGRSTATHAIIHEGAYRGTGAAALADWMTRHGAQRLGTFGSDHLFELPRRPSAPIRLE